MRKRTPDTSKLSRANAAPYTLRKTEPSATNFDVAKTDQPGKSEKSDKSDAKIEKIDPRTLVASDGKVDAKFDDVKSAAVLVEPHDGAPKPGDGAKSATHNEAPTEMPSETPPKAQITEPALPKATVEDPTNMPPAKTIPTGNPTDPALPPGRVPAGDSRSFRRGDEFALVYRQGTCVISRFGTVGQRGQWRVVEYPTSASASNSYAKECSRFVAEGFSDYRD